VNGEKKEYGYIVDYKHLFENIEGAIEDYTNGAFSGYDKADIEGLLKSKIV
jgi:type I restriction enzyme R subunit